MVPRSVKILILLHVCISLAGLLAHLKLHPVGKSLYFFWASPVSVFSLLVITFLFIRPSTVAWGVLFNAMTVLIGTIAMSFYSLHTFERPLTLYNLFTDSTLPNILFLWIKLPISYFILIKIKPLKVRQQVRGCVE